VPLSHCPNKNVFSDCLNCSYDSSGWLRSGGKLFHTLVPAAARVLSPKLRYVQLTLERSSVSRTQMSDTYIGHQSTIVDQVAVWFWNCQSSSVTSAKWMRGQTDASRQRLTRARMFVTPTGLSSRIILERILLHQLSFLVIFLSFYFGSCGRLSWLNCQLSLVILSVYCAVK